MERNTPIKEVSMGIYARVNSRQRVPSPARSRRGRRARFVIVLCSRLTAGDNERCYPATAIIKQQR